MLCCDSKGLFSQKNKSISRDASFAFLNDVVRNMKLKYNGQDFY